MEGESKLKNLKKVPWATLGLIALYLLVLLLEMRADRVGLLGLAIEDFKFHWRAFIVSPLRESPKLLSHTLLHAGWGHFLANALFLFMLGPAVEKTMGIVKFLAFYVFWGAAAALISGYFNPFSPGSIGASGAISGVAGAFFVLHPLRTPPDIFGSIFGRGIRSVPAFFWIGLYFIGQIKLGMLSLGPYSAVFMGPRVDYWAHVGGFIAGGISVAPWIYGRPFIAKNQ